MKRTNFFLGTVKLSVTKCKRPSFKNHAGRTWDAGKIKIDGEEIKAHLDTTCGRFIYFQYGKDLQWHKVPMYADLTKVPKEKDYDIDPFAAEKYVADIITTPIIHPYQYLRQQRKASI